jgi:transposase
MEAMAKHRTYSIEFKHQVAQEYIAGETLHADGRRIWVAKYEAGAFEDDIRASMVGRQALEIESLRGASRGTPRREAGLHSS